MNRDTASQERTARSRRSFSITVSLATVISSILLLSAGFVAVFSLGVLLGRGYNLEAKIPELQRIMPQPSPTAAPLVIADDTPRPTTPAASATTAATMTTAASGAKSAPAAAPEPANGPVPTGIMDQGDLAYRDSLKPSPTSRSAPAKPVPENKPAKAPDKQQDKLPDKQPDKPQDKSQDKRQDKAEPAKSKPEQNTPAQPPVGTAPVRTSAQAAAPAQGGGDAKTYHYVYQGAAYKDKPSCDKFTAKLAAAGFRARTEESASGGTTWYRTVIDFTGKPDDTDALRAKLKNYGVERALLKSKTPVN